LDNVIAHMTGIGYDPVDLPRIDPASAAAASTASIASTSAGRSIFLRVFGIAHPDYAGLVLTADHSLPPRITDIG
jgi:hypothetical protein